MLYFSVAGNKKMFIHPSVCLAPHLQSSVLPFGRDDSPNTVAVHSLCGYHKYKRFMGSALTADKPT
jgi:hypothetical protein